MNFHIRPVSDTDWDSIVAIFNHFVSESFAAYYDQPVDVCLFQDRHSANPSFPFVVAEVQERTVGFAYLAPFHPAATMRHSASLTYFIHPEFTGQGIGSAFFDCLLEAGGGLGITNFMAHISSLNEGSIQFHLKRGFTECGRFVDVGKKNGRLFDMVWLQKLQD